MNADELTTENNAAKFTYTALTKGEDKIDITSANASSQITLNVNGDVTFDVIYVDSTKGLDSNDGKTRQNAVKTIEHAVEIAKSKIIILAGEYTVNSMLNISKDLDISGDGNVLVKNNAKTTY